MNRVASAVRVTDPYCATTADTISYPASYLGEFPFPKVVGAPFATGIKRGADVKDYWLSGIDDPSTNAGCGGSLHTAFIETLKRLQKLGVDHVGISRDARFVDYTAPVMKIEAAAPWAIPYSELVWITATARRFGMGVYDYRQLAGDQQNRENPTTPTLPWVRRFFDAYIPWIVGRAREAQATGVEAFELDPAGTYWSTMTPGSAIETEFLKRFAQAARAVRAVYHGKIMTGVMAPRTMNAELAAAIDYEIIPTFGINFTAADDQNISVAMLKAKYLQVMHDIHDELAPNLKPAVIDVFVQSHRAWYRHGWFEDGFCVQMGNNRCFQRGAKIDFSLQAIGYEALFEAIKAQTDFQVATIEVGATWFVDVILPKDTFPNLSQSWRNKPSEAILRKWFRK